MAKRGSKAPRVNLRPLSAQIDKSIKQLRRIRPKVTTVAYRRELDLGIKFLQKQKKDLTARCKVIPHRVGPSKAGRKK